MFLDYLGLLTIPFTPSSNTWVDTAFTLGRLVLTCVLVLAAAYYTTKWVAGAKYKRTGKSGLRIIDAISVGNQSSVQLIRVGERCVLIGVTRDRITMLTELPKAEVDNIELENAGTDNVAETGESDASEKRDKPSFEKYFERFFKS